MNIYGVRAELRMCSSEQKAQGLRKFFKTGPGEYGEGDVFIGVKVPELRMIARECGELDEEDVIGLFHSKIHEERMLALIILVGRFEKGDKKIRKKIYKMYLENARYVNNWDLVDISAHKIVGAYLMNKSKRILKKLVRSKLLWERRIAIVSTFWFIKNDSFDETLMLSKMLINDSEDLMHKAVGWMLREVGNRSMRREEKFLKKHYKMMPRTMLRYAIEKFPENKRLKYLRGRV